MSLTSITITGTFTRENGEGAQGTVTATLSQTIQNGTTVIEPTPVVGELSSTGKLLNQAGAAFTLYANDDAATSPQGTSYSFLIEVDNAPVREFRAVVKHSAAEGKVDITELESLI
jgi:hypothetical protein